MNVAFRRALRIAVASLFLGLSIPEDAAAQAATPPILRGDANLSGGIDLSDAVFILNYLFLGGSEPPCLAAADANTQRGLDIADAIYLLTFLFVAQVELAPLTEAERAACDAPLPHRVLRHGDFRNVIKPPHGVEGRVEQLSNNVLRIRNFSFDGEGTPMVVIMLHTREWWPTPDWLTSGRNRIISHDLLTEKRPFRDETLEFAIPADFTEFKFVSVYCTDFPLTYAYAQMFEGP
jgi:hypothetical protein